MEISTPEGTDKITEILRLNPGGLRLFKALSTRAWLTQEDAEFVGMEMGKFLIDNMENKEKVQ